MILVLLMTMMTMMTRGIARQDTAYRCSWGIGSGIGYHNIRKETPQTRED